MHVHFLWPIIVTLRLALPVCSEFQQTSLPQLEWWQTSVFYHLYPRSFQDGNGDGVGDLKGIIQKLPQYLHDLDIGAVWLSPIFKSPMKDFGYDISDYESFEPFFGDLADYETLKDKLHTLGIKILLDLVPNHTSDKHEWFQKSLANIEPYSDFYVWVEPKGWNDTEPLPPNNWQSEFTGSAWTFAPQRKKFYLHHFLPQQPDLNYRNPKVVEAMNNVVKFWLEKGVDGFRVDAVPYLFEDAKLRDDPEATVKGPDATSLIPVAQKFSRDQPETFDVVRGWRRVIDEFSLQKDNKTRVMLLEAYASLNFTNQLYNTGENTMSFNFYFIINKINSTSTAQDYNDIIQFWLDNIPHGKWPNWVTDNHDNPRSTSRIGEEMVDAINAMLLLLPGTPVLYNGQEIGMEDTYIPWSAVQDPYALTVGREHYKEVDRDPQRSPMQWDDSVSAGFSTNLHTWLPINPNYYRLNVQAQRTAQVSHYKIVQRLIQLRSEKVFRYGGVKTYVLNSRLFVFTRFLEGEPTYVVVINLDDFSQNVDLRPVQTNLTMLTIHTASVNSENKVGGQISMKSDFLMRPKSCLVLTTDRDLKIPYLPSTNVPAKREQHYHMVRENVNRPPSLSLPVLGETSSQRRLH